MPETFLHGVEVVEITDGPRPIRTVRSSVVGVIGTAPNAQQEVKASLQTGVVGSNNALTFTSKLDGELGNSSSLRLVNPGANNAPLSISVSGRDVTVNLATGVTGAITTTAAQLKTAIEANTAANALFTITNTGASTGAGVVASLRRAQLAGGLDDVFPLNTPVLVPGDAAMAAKLGTAGTLPAALDGIFDQTGAVVVVIRVAEGINAAATVTNVIGGVNVTTGAYEGVHAFLGSESSNGFCPRILCAPGFTSARTSTANPVVAEMVGIAERLRAVVIADGPNTTDAQAITYRGDWGSKRVYIVDPAVQIRNSLGEIVDEPASARVSGLIAKIDNDRGFWWSPSNQVINGIVGTGRQVDFTLGDANSRANLLNEQEVATVIRQDGYRLWGNRTASDDPKFAFLSVVRTADMINDSILRAHMWAVDRNITRTYLEDVAQGVNDYLDRLKAQGAILGGRCFPSVGLNTPANIADGKVFFDVEFTPPFPAEHITFRSKLTNEFIEEIL
jgi:phage tail sheath protein FI